MNIVFCQDKKIFIKRNKTTLSLRLSVNQKGKVTLSVPLFYPMKKAQTFLTEHMDWIDEQLSQKSKQLNFKNGDSLTILGKTLTISHSPTHKGGVQISDCFLLVGGQPEFLTRRIFDFIKKETYTYIDKNARIQADKLYLKINKITLKDTTSRWGSCSGKKNLNFSWRLGMAPLYVLDYIIAHEVSHLKEMNHGPNFWKTVSFLTDKRSEAEIWLRRNGKELY